MKGGALTVAGDEEGSSWLKLGILQISFTLKRKSQIKRELSTTEVRGRSRSKNWRGGATVVPPSPRSSVGNNGGEWIRGVRELHECSGCKGELTGV